MIFNFAYSNAEIGIIIIKLKRRLVFILFIMKEASKTREETCCFTGHRKIPEEEREQLARRLEATVEELIRAGVRYFVAGGALGFDTLAAQTILKLRTQYSQVKLILVLPCETQTRGWPEEDVRIYEEIKKAADKVRYTSVEYTRGCMHKRNRHLVDHSGVCVAYLTESRGGTAYTVDYARKNGVPVINLGEK